MRGISSRDDVLKAKVGRIAAGRSPEEIAFLATLFSCEGRVYAAERIPVEFEEYVQAYGQDTFDRIRQTFLQEGLVAQGTDLYLNFDGDADTFRRILRECSSVLFQQAAAFFVPLIESVMGSEEGAYALTTLAAGDAREDAVSDVYRVVGSVHWNRLRELLSGSGLFFHRSSSRKHDYHSMFPPLRDAVLSQGPVMNAAVAHVYMGQRVRVDGGVLWSDVESVHGPYVALARAVGFIREGKRFSFRTCTTTSKGDGIARQALEARIEAARGLLEARFKEIPNGALRFLVTEVWTGECGQRLRHMDAPPPWAPVSEYPSCLRCSSCSRIHHFCLLRDKRFREAWRDVLDLLVHHGLAVKATSYVGTRGGEARDTEYVLAPETESLLFDVAGVDNQGLRLPPELETIHAMYHLFIRPTEPVGAYREGSLEGPEAMAALAGEYGLPGKQVVGFVDVLSSRGLVRYDEAARVYVLDDPERYRSYVVNGHLDLPTFGQTFSPPPLLFPDVQTAV